jgi:hypothetical protein
MFSLSKSPEGTNIYNSNSILGPDEENALYINFSVLGISCVEVNGIELC